MDQPKETEHLEQFLHREQFQGSIRLDSVSFSYPGTPKPALDQVSTSIRSGERIGILGKTGSGKTTLLKLLVKLLDPDEGNIQIDDLNLTQVNAAELRSNIGYVDQNPTLFSGTLKENIVGATHHATNEEILSVSKTCGILELANQHPLGFGMPVGERGDRLSSGQRQSVALARMMLNQPKILLLDEPTSALDPTTEERIKKNLGTFVDQRTLLLVTHRLSLLDLVDRIIILDKGRVIADGPHDQIIAAMKGNTPNESSD
jgi:ATP-binding cassette subfamily C protein LapB